MSTNEAAIRADLLSNLEGSLDVAGRSLGNAARKVKKAASSGLYNVSYGASFGVVFAAVFLVELLPGSNVIRRGLEDGAEAGLDSAIAKAESARARRRPSIEKPVA